MKRKGDISEVGCGMPALASCSGGIALLLSSPNLSRGLDTRIPFALSLIYSEKLCEGLSSNYGLKLTI